MPRAGRQAGQGGVPPHGTGVPTVVPSSARAVWGPARSAADGPPQRPTVLLDERARKTLAQLLDQPAQFGVVELVQDRAPGAGRDLAEVVLPVGVTPSDLPQGRRGDVVEAGGRERAGDRVGGGSASVLDLQQPGEDLEEPAAGV